MAENSSVSILGAMGLIKKSKFNLAPLFEAITNSLESISAQEYVDTEPTINIDFYYTGLFQDQKDFEKISVTDNGSGFTDENYDRFKTLLDKSKGFNNRGSGRIQFLHRFDKIDIYSRFQQDGKTHQRTFTSTKKNLVANESRSELPENGISETKIELSDFNGDKADVDFFNSVTIDEIYNAIRKKFLLKFYLEQKNPNLKAPKIIISFYKNSVQEKSLTLDTKDIPAPQSEGDINVPYLKLRDPNSDDPDWIESGKKEELKWAYFKLPDDVLDQNGVFLCSKDVTIQEVPFLKIKKNESFQGSRHLTVVHGNILDAADNVSDSVDRFLFPTQKEIEKELKTPINFDPEHEYLFIDTIEDVVKKSLPEAYSEIEELKEQQSSKAFEIAKAHGIPYDVAKQVKIDLTDSEEKITEKLYKRQAEELSKNNFKIKKLFDSLNDLNPVDADYQSELEKRGKELLELIPQQNKQELSRYIIRREMVTGVLKLILENNLSYQQRSSTEKERKDKEGLIHDLIFKRKSTGTDSLNDLWILNEEFLHFEGCSDIPINQIEDSAGQKLLNTAETEDTLFEKFGLSRHLRRPDIFLYVEEGKCVLIEFKAHEIDLSDHLNQLTRYCNLIANRSRSKIDQFFCYLIGEKIERMDLPGEFIKSVTGDFIKPNQPIRSFEEGKEENIIAYLHQEIIQLSAIHKRAAVRNKSFADKLGIRV